MARGADIVAAKDWGKSVGRVCFFNGTIIPERELPFRGKRDADLRVAFCTGFKLGNAEAVNFQKGGGI